MTAFAGELTEIDQIRTGLPGVVRDSQKVIGFVLVAKERTHFAKLSTGGSSNRTTWPQMSQATLAKRRALQRRGLLGNADPEQIGVLTGRLAKSFRFRIVGNQVALINVAPEANVFSAKRPLYPSTVPKDWLDRADQALQSRLNRLTRPLS